MTFAVVIEGMTIVAFAVLICGGKQRREQGWGVMAILAGLAAFIQIAAMALIVRSPKSLLLGYVLTHFFSTGLPFRERRPFLRRLVS